jgi:hypothetical protein
VVFVGKIRRKFLASLNARSWPSPEREIWSLLEVVASFSPLARKAWRNAESRVFSVGYQATDFVTLVHEHPPGSGRMCPKDYLDDNLPTDPRVAPTPLTEVSWKGGRDER